LWAASVAWRVGVLLDHCQSGDPFGMAIGLGEAGIDDHPVAFSISPHGP
jgi:hypothetical protein